MRLFHLLASAAAITLSASSATAQRYEIPDRLGYLNLPADPAEFIRQAVNHERNLYEVWEFGCPSVVGGYAGAVFDMLLEAAATDFEIRRAITTGGGSPPMDCAVDFARWKTWYFDLLEREYRAGLHHRDNTNEPAILLHKAITLLRGSTDPAHHALAREIARDAKVYDAWRMDAVEAMVAHRMQAGTPKLEAEREVMLDMATAPAIHASDQYLDSSSWEWLTVKRLSEHFDGFWCEYNRLAYENRTPDPDLLARRDRPVVGGPRIDPKPCRE